MKIAIAAFEVTHTLHLLYYNTRLFFKLMDSMCCVHFILGIQMEVIPLTSLQIGLMK